MKIEVLENEDEKVKIKVDTNLTLVNLLNDALWKQKVSVAAYKKDHPYLSQPVLLIKSKNPKKSILDATDYITEQLKEFRRQLTAAMK